MEERRTKRRDMLRLFGGQGGTPAPLAMNKPIAMVMVNMTKTPSR